MVNENLGTICNAYVVYFDLSLYGVLDEKCFKLVEFVVLVVDFFKIGKIVIMFNEFKFKMYFDFMGKLDF